MKGERAETQLCFPVVSPTEMTLTDRYRYKVLVSRDKKSSSGHRRWYSISFHLYFCVFSEEIILCVYMLGSVESQRAMCKATERCSVTVVCASARC